MIKYIQQELNFNQEILPNYQRRVTENKESTNTYQSKQSHPTSKISIQELSNLLIKFGLEIIQVKIKNYKVFMVKQLNK